MAASLWRLFALWAIQDFSRRHRFLALDLWGGQFEYRIPVLISEAEIALRAEGFNFRLTFQIEPLAGGSVVFSPARVGGKNHFLAHDDKNLSRADLFVVTGRVLPGAARRRIIPFVMAITSWAGRSR